MHGTVFNLVFRKTNWQGGLTNLETGHILCRASMKIFTNWLEKSTVLHTTSGNDRQNGQYVRWLLAVTFKKRKEFCVLNE